MNAQVDTTESRALTLAERATSAIAISKTEAQLTELAASTKTIVSITNPAAYTQVHAARMVLKGERVSIEKAGKAAREDATAFSRAVIQVEQKLVGIIKPEETRLEALQAKWDEAREAEKLAKAEAEKARVAAIQSQIAQLRGNDRLTSLYASSVIAEQLESLESLPADESFQEFQQAAIAAKAAGVARLQELLQAALAREAEEQRLADERAQLERDKAEAKRVEGIKRRIQDIRDMAVGASQLSSQKLQALIDKLDAAFIDESFQEFSHLAVIAAEATTAQLETILAQRIEHEKEQYRLSAERAQLEIQRKEQEERLAAEAAAERARIAQEERQAKEKREAEERAAAQQRAEEQRKLIAQQQALDAEKQRLAEHEAELERRFEESKNLDSPAPGNAVAPDQHHGEGNAVTSDSPVGDLGDRVASAVAGAGESIQPSLDEIIFALMTEFGASRELVTEWIVLAAMELQGH